MMIPRILSLAHNTWKDVNFFRDQMAVGPTDRSDPDEICGLQLLEGARLHCGVAHVGSDWAGDGASAADAAAVSAAASATAANETRMDFLPRKARNRHQCRRNRKWRAADDFSL